jgi:hypothetical protein
MFFNWASTLPSLNLAASPTVILQVQLQNNERMPPLLAPLAPLAPHSLHLLSTSDFNGVDGIIGFGLPVAHAPAQPPAPPASMFGGMQVFRTEFTQQTNTPLTLSQSPFAPSGAAAAPVVLPVPLLFALTDPKVQADANNRLMHQRAFSFFSTEDSAEVQLGGYDPARCVLFRFAAAGARFVCLLI